MSTLVFDIETAPNVGNTLTEDSLSPATAKIATISVYDIERQEGTIYIEGTVSPSTTADNWHVKVLPEKDILHHFWEGTRQYDVFVGYGIRRFDIPFIVHRSIALQVQLHNRLQNRKILTQQQLPFVVDLQDEFSLYGNMSKPLSLLTLVKLYKLQEKILFKDATSFLTTYLNLNMPEVVTHATQKNLATTRLYERWQETIAPPHFLNTIAL